MKILHVNTNLKTGGAEKLMVDMLPKLRAAGHDVELLIFDGKRTPFYEQLEASGVPIHSLGMRDNVYSPLYLWRLFRFLRKHKFDVVHSHNYAPQLFCALYKFIGRVMLCTTEHNTSNRRRDWTWYAQIDRFMYSRYARVICCSDATEANLRAFIGDKSDRILTIPNGIDVQAYAKASPCEAVIPKPAVQASPLSRGYDVRLYQAKQTPVASEACAQANASSARGDGVKTLMQVSGFRVQKDQDTVIRALKLLPQNVHAVFVGDGERRAECEALAESLGVKERAHFLGVRADVASLLKSADVAVQSSHWEGFGLAAAEAMATGKPVVASDVPGLREVVSGAGLLFPQGDEKALAQAVTKLLEDKDFYEKTAQACSERAEKFDISKMVEGYLGVYKSLFPSSNPRKKLIRLTTTARALNEQLKGQLRFLNEHFEVVAVASGKEILQEIAEREGVRVLDVPMRREIALWQDVKSLLALFRLFRKERPDIVHANTPKASLLAMTAAFLARVPHRLYTVTGLRFETTTGSFRFLLKTMERFTCRFATKVIPEGDGVKDTLLRERITRKPLEKILNGNLNGIDLNYFARTPEVSASAEKLRAEMHISGSSSVPCPRLSFVEQRGSAIACGPERASVWVILPYVAEQLMGDTPTQWGSGPEGDHASSPLPFSRGGAGGEDSWLSVASAAGNHGFVFGFVGRIVRDKGVNELVRAFAKLKAKTPACRLLLLGNFEDDLNPIADDVRAEIHREGSGIVLPGYQKDLRPYYAAMDALVHPSYREGFPNVVLQAGAMGVPCIVSDINGCNEIIREGENGTIVPPRDEQALLDAMTRFLEERNTTLPKMASKARELIASRYEQRAVWNATLEMYRGL